MSKIIINQDNVEEIVKAWTEMDMPNLKATHSLTPQAVAIVNKVIDVINPAIAEQFKTLTKRAPWTRQGQPAQQVPSKSIQDRIKDGIAKLQDSAAKGDLQAQFNQLENEFQTLKAKYEEFEDVVKEKVASEQRLYQLTQAITELTADQKKQLKALLK